MTQLNHFSIKGLTNRYCMQKVTYPKRVVNPIGSLVIEAENASTPRKGSIDDEIFIEGEIFLFASSKVVNALEIKQPSYNHLYQCFNFEKEPFRICCLSAFALPKHYQQSTLPIPTAILLVLEKSETQFLKIYEDKGKEINYEIDCK